MWTRIPAYVCSVCGTKQGSLAVLRSNPNRVGELYVSLCVPHWHCIALHCVARTLGPLPAHSWRSRHLIPLLPHAYLRPPPLHAHTTHRPSPHRGARPRQAACRQQAVDQVSPSPIPFSFIHTITLIPPPLLPSPGDFMAPSYTESASAALLRDPETGGGQMRSDATGAGEENQPGGGTSGGR